MKESVILSSMVPVFVVAVFVCACITHEDGEEISGTSSDTESAFWDSSDTGTGQNGLESDTYTDMTTGMTTDMTSDTNMDDVTDADTDRDTDSDSDSIVDTGEAIPKSCKRGVAYGHHSAADMAALSTGVRWWYNWYFAPDTGIGETWRTLGVQFVPMRWGSNYSITDVSNGIPNGVDVILGFNEPNFFSQANLSATDAAAMWPELEALADEKGLRLVSPAVNFCGGGCHSDGPVEYLNEFFGACDGCRVDAIAIHIYVECDENSSGLQRNRAQWLINHVEMYKNAFDKPLWLTEFACSGSPSKSEQQAFLEAAVAYLESEPRIERYAWFAGRADNMVNVDLLGDDGALTALGEAYVDAPFNQACP